VVSTDHRRGAPMSVRCFILTISDTRTEENDISGDTIAGLLTTSGHAIGGRAIVKDDPHAVRVAVTGWAPIAQAIITTGGTGISSRDRTYEALSDVLDKRLDGFGELFRALSYQEIGSAAMLTRACAGTIGKTALFCLPGAEHAVRLGMMKLILPELAHVVRELNR
jgi:molybdenum cofactor biosynthesis protein B